MNNLARLPVAGETILFANPYNLDAKGFYFSTADEFREKADNLVDRHGCPVEEFSIEFIDGDDAALFEACGIRQGNLATWFDDVEPLDDHEKAALFYLTDCNGYTLDAALERLDDVSLYLGDLDDAAAELFDEIYLPEVPEHAQSYIDYAAFARDCRLSGDMAEKQRSAALAARPGCFSCPPEGRGPGGLPAGGVVTPSEGKLQGIPKARRVI